MEQSAARFHVSVMSVGYASWCSGIVNYGQHAKHRNRSPQCCDNESNVFYFLMQVLQ